MRHKLILQPIHSSSADILHCFIQEKPLSPEQLNFLDWHQKQLSSAQFDPVVKYYTKSSANRRKKYQGTFLLPHEEINFEAIQQLKKRIQLALKGKEGGVEFKITQKQFLDFKHHTKHELIFLNGNHFLINAPVYYPTNIPPVMYFQWGKLFGVLKYVMLTEDMDLKEDILIYIQDMQDRNLYQCVNQYEDKIAHEKELQRNILYDNKIEEHAFSHFLLKP